MPAVVWVLAVAQVSALAEGPAGALVLLALQHSQP